MNLAALGGINCVGFNQKHDTNSDTFCEQKKKDMDPKGFFFFF